MFDEFDQTLIGGKEAIDQYGSGIYFFNTPDRTIRHGNIRITAVVEIGKTIDVNKVYRRRLSRETVERLILASPDFDDKIRNCGDVDYYGVTKVLYEIIPNYRDLDYVSMLNTIGNDFYSPEDTYILLKRFAELTGYNCIVNKELGIYNILTVDQITIKKINYEWETDDNEDLL